MTYIRWATSRATILTVSLVIIFNTSLASPQDRVAPDAQSTNEKKSEAVAFRRSLLGTLVPVAVGIGLAARGPTNNDALLPFALIEGGLIVGPALGHFYAERPTYAAITTGVRAAVAVGSLLWALSACPEFEDCSGGEETRQAVVFLAGAGLVAASAIYDIIAAPASIKKRNQDVGNCGVMPFLFPEGRIVGVAAYLQF